MIRQLSVALLVAFVLSSSPLYPTTMDSHQPLGGVGGADSF
ncbi:hypothetical protein J32TS2_05520 [Shouchella clausii]|nr:hypothetical protein J32TS2_05520 [Shouchella clausii]SHL71987.1 hypothetical protein SAMN05192535_3142 [Shouchella rhizosphaerae]